MADSLFYKMRSGKPIKFLCFLKNFASLLVPDVLYRSRLKKKLEKAHHRPDYAYMQQRVDYYMRITTPWKMAETDKLDARQGLDILCGSYWGLSPKDVSYGVLF